MSNNKKYFFLTIIFFISYLSMDFINVSSNLNFYPKQEYFNQKETSPNFLNHFDEEYIIDQESKEITKDSKENTNSGRQLGFVPNVLNNRKTQTKSDILKHTFGKTFCLKKTEDSTQNSTNVIPSAEIIDLLNIVVNDGAMEMHLFHPSKTLILPLKTLSNKNNHYSTKIHNDGNNHINSKHDYFYRSEDSKCLEGNKSQKFRLIPSIICADQEQNICVETKLYSLIDINKNSQFVDITVTLENDQKILLSFKNNQLKNIYTISNSQKSLVDSDIEEFNKNFYDQDKLIGMKKESSVAAGGKASGTFFILSKDSEIFLTNKTFVFVDSDNMAWAIQDGVYYEIKNIKNSDGVIEKKEIFRLPVFNSEYVGTISDTSNSQYNSQTLKSKALSIGTMLVTKYPTLTYVLSPNSFVMQLNDKDNQKNVIKNQHKDFEIEYVSISKFQKESILTGSGCIDQSRDNNMNFHGIGSEKIKESAFINSIDFIESRIAMVDSIGQSFDKSVPMCYTGEHYAAMGMYCFFDDDGNFVLHTDDEKIVIGKDREMQSNGMAFETVYSAEQENLKNHTQGIQKSNPDIVGGHVENVNGVRESYRSPGEDNISNYYLNSPVSDDMILRNDAEEKVGFFEGGQFIVDGNSLYKGHSIKLNPSLDEGSNGSGNYCESGFAPFCYINSIEKDLIPIEIGGCKVKLLAMQHDYYDCQGSGVDSISIHNNGGDYLLTASIAQKEDSRKVFPNYSFTKSSDMSSMFNSTGDIAALNPDTYLNSHKSGKFISDSMYIYISLYIIGVLTKRLYLLNSSFYDQIFAKKKSYGSSIQYPCRGQLDWICNGIALGGCVIITSKYYGYVHPVFMSMNSYLFFELIFNASIGQEESNRLQQLYQNISLCLPVVSAFILDPFIYLLRFFTGKKKLESDDIHTYITKDERLVSNGFHEVSNSLYSSFVSSIFVCAESFGDKFSKSSKSAYESDKMKKFENLFADSVACKGKVDLFYNFINIMRYIICCSGVVSISKDLFERSYYNDVS